MKTFLFVGCNAHETIWKYTHSDLCEIFKIYRGSNSLVFSYIRIIWFKYGFPMRRIWYRKVPDISDTRIILFDDGVTLDYINYLEKNQKNNRIIVFFWNKINDNNIELIKRKSSSCEYWSFDKEDCATYGMQYNPQFYFRSWYANINNVDGNDNIDICFVGRDKNGRMREVNRIKKELLKNGITVHCYFTADKWYRKIKNKEYQAYLNFEDMIMKECEGNAILDYYIGNQVGLTLRVFDALINNRKVVTNNSEIKNIPIYSEENVFILGKDKLNDLRAFLDAPFKPIEKTIIDECSEMGWLAKFENSK